ncbi:unnamed protein product [Penicillium viridicatum]
MTTAPRTHDDYNIGWICALPLEMAAAKLVLDNVHPTLSQPRQDHNTYVLGDINGHNVVVACLPSGVYGTTAAAVVGSQMLSTYHKIRFGLLVGIGGGVPSASVDIRLGDVVVSNPTGVLPGVVQYDFGRTMESGRIERTGSLSLPHPALLTTLSHVRSDHMMTSPRFQKYVSEILRSREQDDDGEPSMFQYPGQDQDVLFRANYRHLDSEADCWSCDWTQVVGRRQRLSKTSKVHYGLIASGNQVMKDGCTRDSLARQLGIICFEMEAAGLMNHFPCLVIRGICDYADSHKNKSWQGYAALTAAAYAKELLSAISSIHPEPGTRMDPRVQVPESFAVRFSSIDRPHMHFFVGREQELAEINANIQSYACRKSVVLYGLGGIGKTQLALAHIIHYLQFYTAVFWFDATNETAMGKSVMRMIWRVLQDHPSLTQLGAMLEEVDIDAAIEWASRWLSSPSNGRWLLVYDNYMPTSEFSIRPWLPNVPQGHILITARSADPTLGHCIRVSKLGMDHSIRLVCEESGRHDLTGDPYMHELVQELDGLPLSLASAGAFLHQKSISCHDYLKRYKKCWLRTPERTPSPHSDGERKLESTWLVSLGSINEQNATASLLLFLWAALDSQELWFELVQRGRHIFKRSERPVEMDEIAFHEAMRVLCIYGFAEIGPAPRDETNESRGYTLNRCVHAWLVSGVVPDRHQTFNAIALYCVTEHASEFWHIENTYISRFWSFEARNICHRLLPHANHLLHLSLSEDELLAFIANVHHDAECFSDRAPENIKHGQSTKVAPTGHSPVRRDARAKFQGSAPRRFGPPPSQ